VLAVWCGRPGWVATGPVLPAEYDCDEEQYEDQVLHVAPPFNRNQGGVPRAELVELVARVEMMLCRGRLLLAAPREACGSRVPSAPGTRSGWGEVSFKRTAVGGFAFRVKRGAV
jgi:hypothetical protein